MFKKQTPTEKLGTALRSLEATAAAVQEAVTDLRVERDDLADRLIATDKAVNRGDEVAKNLTTLLGL